MRFDRLDLNLLTVLDAVLEERHVGRAARRVNLSQPAMSNALKRLRDFLDDPLLVRAGNVLVPTPRAEALHQPVREILDKIRAELVVRPSFDPASSDRLFVITASDYTIQTLLLPAFRTFDRTAPKLRFQVFPLGGDVREDFARGDTDLLIAPSQIVAPDHPSETLFEDDYVVSAWTGNTMIGETLDADTYFALGHVNATFGKFASVAFDEWLEQSTGRKRRIEISFPSFRDVPEVLIGTNRIATMHRRYAANSEKTLPLRLLPIPFEHPMLVQKAQWHRLRNNDLGIRWLIDALRETARTDYINDAQVTMPLVRSPGDE